MATFWGPVLTQTLMVWPSVSWVPLAGSVRMTFPASTVSLAS